ncbi:hypothetical protein [Streptomyces sp. NPDC088915]|uniref:hypothetical protein n=1 Tax=Streptomyces sp. NPDC088915 TaxID=3365912 RepID=UPI00381208A0
MTHHRHGPKTCKNMPFLTSRHCHDLTGVKPTHRSGDMDSERARELEKLGTVRSHHDVAREEGLAAARVGGGERASPGPARRRPPGAAVGIWLKNARAAARQAAELEQRRTEGLPVESWAGALLVAAGETVRRGEDPGRWVRAQWLGFGKLTSVQQWRGEHVLGITPPPRKRSQRPG